MPEGVRATRSFRYLVLSRLRNGHSASQAGEDEGGSGQEGGGREARSVSTTEASDGKDQRKGVSPSGRGERHCPRT